MINIEWLTAWGERVKMSYNVHPASQDQAVTIPEGAAAVRVWLGTRDPQPHDKGLWVKIRDDGRETPWMNVGAGSLRPPEVTP